MIGLNYISYVTWFCSLYVIYDFKLGWFLSWKCLCIRMIQLPIVLKSVLRYVRMGSLVHVEVYKIAVNCIRTTDQRWKPDENHPHIWNGQKSQHFCFRKFYFDFLLFPWYWKPLRVWRAMKCLINIVKHTNISFFIYIYIWYRHTNRLVCEWDVQLHGVGIMFVLK